MRFLREATDVFKLNNRALPERTRSRAVVSPADMQPASIRTASGRGYEATVVASENVSDKDNFTKTSSHTACLSCGQTYSRRSISTGSGGGYNCVAFCYRRDFITRSSIISRVFDVELPENVYGMKQF